MRKTFLVVLVIGSLNVFGQNHFIGLKGGISMTNITENFFLYPPDYRKGISTGLTYEYLFKKNFLVGTDLIYNQRGFTNDLVLTNNTGNPTGERYISIYNYDYLSLPIKTGFNIGNKFYGFMNIGVILSLLVHAKTIVPTINIPASVTTETNSAGTVTVISAPVYIEGYSSDVTDRVNKFDFAGIAEIGGGYKFKSRYCLFASFAYQHSLTSITNDNYFTSRLKIRHNGMALHIGLKYALQEANTTNKNIKTNSQNE
ncbi:MAG: PorT family protein [Bacteroidetes bacterium]|nr:PorT family protein [Bacteroidota bacterium]